MVTQCRTEEDSENLLNTQEKAATGMLFSYVFALSIFCEGAVRGHI
jgi:hypothetical protein